MKKVFDQTVRDLKREVNKKVLKVPGIEQKVLDATSNEPLGPHGSRLAEIALASQNYQEYQLIMSVIWKRMNDTGKNWRHVYKGLTVLEYLVANGSERVIDEIKEHSYQISTLANFQYVNSSGRDQGSNVRKRSQILVALVNDKERIHEIREKACANREKHRNDDVGGRERTKGHSEDTTDGQGGRPLRNHRKKRGSDDSDVGIKHKNPNKARSHSLDDDDDHEDAPSRNTEDKVYEDHIGVPPSYEEATKEIQSQEHVGREGETPITSPTSSPSPNPHPASQSESTELQSTSTVDQPVPSQENDFDAFSEFDPRGLPPIEPAGQAIPEVDIFGLLSTENSMNSLGSTLISSSATIKVDSPSGAGFNNIITPPPASFALDQFSEDPFGDSPFKAIPYESAIAPPKTDATASASASASAGVFESVAGTSQNLECDSEFSFDDLGFNTHGFTPAPNVPENQPAYVNPKTSYEGPVVVPPGHDILGDLFAQFASEAPNFSKAPQPLPPAIPQVASSSVLTEMPLSSASQEAPPNPFLQPGISSQQSPLNPFIQSEALVQGAPPNPFTQPGLPSSGTSPNNPFGSLSQESTSNPYVHSTQSSTDIQSIVSNSGFSSSIPATSYSHQLALSSQSTIPNLSQSGLSAPLDKIEPMSQGALPNLIQSGLSATQPGVQSQPGLATTSAPPTRTAEPTEKFEPKSAVWVDTLSRGLVNFNISGPKINPLADIGIDFDSINRKEKKSTTPPVSTINMGKAMGSGSGLGRAGATDLAPSLNPMVGYGMGVYGGGVHQQMSNGMNMGMGQVSAMQMENGMTRGPGMVPGQGMQAHGYNNMIGNGTNGHVYQQEHGRGT